MSEGADDRNERHLFHNQTSAAGLCDVMDTPSDEATAKPLLAIGVTGHRPTRLDGVDPADLAKAVSIVMGRIAAAVGERHALRLVSSLAEGADSIAADAALAMGWALDVVLPFARADNVDDYPDDMSRAALDARLDRAQAVFALDGQRGDAGAEAQAYERAGRIMLAQSDMLLAIWDGEPPRGRGGTAQIIAEAVAQSVPVIHIGIAPDTAPELLWDGLDEDDSGQQSLETVPRGPLDRLDQLIAHLTEGPAAVLFPAAPRPSWRLSLAIAYPLLLAITGVRRLRRADFAMPPPDQSARQLSDVCRATGGASAFADRLRAYLVPAFAVADATSIEAARRFRSAYIANFGLAAFAVMVSLIGLVLAADAKPFLAAIELATVAAILAITHIGRRAGWHQRWLDCRQTAERLRCLAIGAQLGELSLRGNAHPVARRVARALRLPDVLVDAGYLGDVHDDLMRLLADQIDYLELDARRMHHLEHRLHRAGEWLFGLTATLCLAFLAIEIVAAALPEMHALVHPTLVWGTIGSAALPAIGAAIYGIRMQGDFAGIAERNEALAQQLRRVRYVSSNEPLAFDTLLRRARRVSDLLTEDLSSFLHAYHARPLVLPG